MSMSAPTTTIQARDIQPGQTVRFKRYAFKARSPRYTVEVEKVEVSETGRTAFVYGCRVYQTAWDKAMGPEYKTYTRRKLFSMGAEEMVEVMS